MRFVLLKRIIGGPFSRLNCNNALYNAGLPVLFVVIGLAVRHEHYGIRDDEGHLLLYVRCLHADIAIIFA